MSDQYGTPWRDPQPAPGPQYPAQYPAPSDPYAWPAAQYPPPPPPPPPPAPRKRRVHPAVWIVAGVVVAAVVVGLLVAVLTKNKVVDAPGTGGRQLAIPTSIAGYTPTQGVNTDDLLANLGEQLAGKGEDPDAVVRHGAVGVFDRRSDGGRAVFVGIALRDVASFRGQVHDDGVESTLKVFLAGAGAKVGGAQKSTAFSPGRLKGFLRCSTGDVGGAPATVCGWGDESAFALTVLSPALSLPVAAAATRTLREAIERT